MSTAGHPACAFGNHHIAVAYQACQVALCPPTLASSPHLPLPPVPRTRGTPRRHRQPRQHRRRRGSRAGRPGGGAVPRWRGHLRRLPRRAAGAAEARPGAAGCSQGALAWCSAMPPGWGLPGFGSDLAFTTLKCVQNGHAGITKWIACACPIIKARSWPRPLYSSAGSRCHARGHARSPAPPTCACAD